jgi:hypothetical protein
MLFQHARKVLLGETLCKLARDFDWSASVLACTIGFEVRLQAGRLRSSHLGKPKIPAYFLTAL